MIARYVLPAAVLSTLALGVVCQFVQSTDPAFPLMYFTVDSGIFGAVVAGLVLIRPTLPQLPMLRAAASVGVLLSAIIYTAVIAPASDTGTWIQPHDDDWVRAATFLLHLVGPIVITFDIMIQDAHRMPVRSMLGSALAWPFDLRDGPLGRLLGWAGADSVSVPRSSTRGSAGSDRSVRRCWAHHPRITAEEVAQWRREAGFA